MALSQEEINKIHEEETERAKAQQKYSKKRQSIAGPGCLIFIIIAVIAIGISSCNNAQNKAQQSMTQQRYVGDTHIDFKEYIDQPASFYIEKLGQPDGGEYYADLPTYTNWMWKKDGFIFNISFPKGSPNHYVDIQFEDGVCDQDSAYYFNKVGLNYPNEAADTKYVGVMYRWEPYTDHYDRLNLYCNSNGTRIVLISQVE